MDCTVRDTMWRMRRHSSTVSNPSASHRCITADSARLFPRPPVGSSFAATKFALFLLSE